MTFRIVKINLAQESFFIVQQRFRWFWLIETWIMPFRAYSEFTTEERNYNGSNYVGQIRRYIQFGSVEEAGKAIDACRKRWNMFDKKQIDSKGYTITNDD